LPVLAAKIPEILAAWCFLAATLAVSLIVAAFTLGLSKAKDKR
jgi:hypothetical protein